MRQLAPRFAHAIPLLLPKSSEGGSQSYDHGNVRIKDQIKNLRDVLSRQESFPQGLCPRERVDEPPRRNNRAVRPR